MSVRWRDLTVCGIPVTLDPTQGDGDIEAQTGDVLIVNVQVDDEGLVIGATGHVERGDPGDETSEQP